MGAYDARNDRFSIVDAAIYLCWAVADYVLIGYVSGHYGEPGLVTLAVVISLIGFGVVLDGVGMAVQPLLGTYLGEGNNVMKQTYEKIKKYVAENNDEMKVSSLHIIKNNSI